MMVKRKFGKTVVIMSTYPLEQWSVHSVKYGLRPVCAVWLDVSDGD